MVKKQIFFRVSSNKMFGVFNASYIHCTSEFVRFEFRVHFYKIIELIFKKNIFKFKSFKHKSSRPYVIQFFHF